MDKKIELGSLGGLNFVKLWEKEHPQLLGDEIAINNMKRPRTTGSMKRGKPKRKPESIHSANCYKTITKNVAQSPIKYAGMHSPSERFGVMHGHAPSYPGNAPDVEYDEAIKSHDLGDKTRFMSISFTSKEPRVWEPPKSGVDYRVAVASLDYDKGGEWRPYGIHDSFEKRLAETSIKYKNVRSPVDRFRGVGKAEIEWKEKLGALEYNPDYGKYQTSVTMVEQSARSYPEVRADRGSFNIRFSGKSAQFR